MPRKPVVPHDELLTAILSQPGTIDSNGIIPGPTDAVWKSISDEFEGLSPKYIYQFVHENRHDSYNNLLRYHGIPTPQTSPMRATCDYSSDSSSDIPPTPPNEYQLLPQETFVVNFSPKEWETIKPVEKMYNRKDRGTKRRVLVLPPNIWESIITEKLWEQHRIPCAYKFMRARVSLDAHNSSQYVKIDAQCTFCNSTGTGRILSEPIIGESVQMEWRANDSRGIPHKRKRHLTGDIRNKMSSLLKNSSASAYRRLLARNLMDQGDVEPPHLFSEEVLRKAKQQKRDEGLHIRKGVHPILNLSDMKHTQPYAGSIHDVALDKVMVQYWTPAQIMVYKTFWKDQFVSLSLDATGTLVKRLHRRHGLSGNIFLYELVMNTGDFQLPVSQMLSEKHDANSILYWLQEWSRSGAPCPNEIVVDNSNALKSALVRSFGRSSDVKKYILKCFLLLQDSTNEKPPCYIRLDVAHFLNAASKWDIWRDKEKKRLKDFYLRCLGILIKSQSLSEFEETLEHILIIARSPNEGKDDHGENLPMEHSLDFLSKKIKGDINPMNECTVTEEEQVNSDISLPECHEETENVSKTSIIAEWLDGIRKHVREKTLENHNGRLNPYFIPSVAVEFERLAVQFPLWSAVMVKIFHSPYLTASSASVEGDFSDLKCNILKGTARPMRIDKFVATHLQSIEGSCRIAGASQIKSATKEAHNTLVSEVKSLLNERNTASEAYNVNTISNAQENKVKSCKDSESLPFNTHNPSALYEDLMASEELNQIENWRGLAAKAPGRRKSTYLHPLPELDAAIKAKKLKQPSNRLLRNGNVAGFATVEPGTQIRVTNTCAFDAICQIFAAAYINYEEYRLYVDNTGNSLLRTAKSLAIAGAVKTTVNLRAETLAAILDPLGTLVAPIKKSLQERTTNITLEYDCWANVGNLAKELLRGVPSAEVLQECSDSMCTAERSRVYGVIETNAKVLLSEGFGSLEKATLMSLGIMEAHENVEDVTQEGKMVKCRPPCQGSLKVSFNFGRHLVIDVDYMSVQGTPQLLNVTPKYNRTPKLSDLPVSIRLCDLTYNLVGVVAHMPGHWVAYIRRLPDSWELHDDLAKKVVLVNDEQDLRPSLLVFVVKSK